MLPLYEQYSSIVNFSRTATVFTGSRQQAFLFAGTTNENSATTGKLNDYNFLRLEAAFRRFFMSHRRECAYPRLRRLSSLRTELLRSHSMCCPGASLHSMGLAQ